MSKSQRDKGQRRERQIVDLHIAAGIRAERVPLSGAAKFRNTEKTDVDVYVNGPDEAPWITEVKARASGEGFKTITKWLADADALFLIEDRAQPLVVLPWHRWRSLVTRRKHGETLIRDSYFERYAMELADDSGREKKERQMNVYDLYGIVALREEVDRLQREINKLKSEVEHTKECFKGVHTWEVASEQIFCYARRYDDHSKPPFFRCKYCHKRKA